MRGECVPTFCFYVHSFSFAYIEVCRAVEMMTTTILISVPSLKRSVSVCVDKLITTERGTIYTNTLTNTQHRRAHGRTHGPAWTCRCVMVVVPVSVQPSIHRSSGHHEASREHVPTTTTTSVMLLTAPTPMCEIEFSVNGF